MESLHGFKADPEVFLWKPGIIKQYWNWVDIKPVEITNMKQNLIRKSMKFILIDPLPSQLGFFSYIPDLTASWVINNKKMAQFQDEDGRIKNRGEITISEEKCKFFKQNCEILAIS